MSYLLTAIGAAAIIAGIGVAIQSAVSPVKNAMAAALYPGDQGRFLCRVAGRAMLPNLREFYIHYFGDDVPTLDAMNAWLDRCPTAFHAIYRVTPSSSTSNLTAIVGSFKILPLSRSGAAAIERGQVTGSTFKPEHVAKINQKIFGYYVGDVAASGRFAKGMVMAYLISACQPALQSGVPIYARPLTRDGLRVMLKHGFEAISVTAQPLGIGSLARLRPDMGSMELMASANHVIAS